MVGRGLSLGLGLSKPVVSSNPIPALAGLTFWGNGQNVVLNGGKVETMTNLSSGTDVATQVTASARPLVNTASDNGLDTISLLATATGSLALTQSASATRTHTFVIKQVSGEGDFVNGGTNSKYVSRVSRWEYGRNSVPSNVIFDDSGGSSVANTNLTILTMAFDSLSNSRLYVNGEECQTSPIDPRDEYASRTAYTIGLTGGHNFAEFVSNSVALSEADILSVHAFLGAKYAITLA